MKKIKLDADTLRALIEMASAEAQSAFDDRERRTELMWDAREDWLQACSTRRRSHRLS